MELFYQACEVAATGSEVVMMLYFVSKFLGCRYQGWQNRIFQFLSFFVIFNYMMIVDKIFLPYNAVKDFVVMLLYILYALLLTKGARLYQIILPAAGIIMIAGINISVHEIISAMFHLKAEQLLEEQNNLRVAALFITKFLFFLLTQVVLNRVHLKKAKFRKKEFFSIFIVFFVSAVMMIYMFQFQYNSKQVNIKRFVMVFYVGIILINICVLPLLSMLAERNQKELQYTIMQTQLEEQKAEIEKMPILQPQLKKEHFENYFRWLALRLEHIEDRQTFFHTVIRKVLVYPEKAVIILNMTDEMADPPKREQVEAFMSNVGEVSLYPCPNCTIVKPNPSRFCDICTAPQRSKAISLM